jgi:hypothetical protein
MGTIIKWIFEKKDREALGVMGLAQDRERKPTLVHTVTNLRAPVNFGDSLAG